MSEVTFDRPVFLLSAPRSGSSLLFLTLAQAPGVFTIGGESHQLIEGISGLHPYWRGWSSNALGAEDAPPVAEAVRTAFCSALRDRDGRPPSGPVGMIEKTPKNSLRVPFLHAIFPDARFLFLYRDPRETLSSMMEAWESARFRTYPRLPDWPGLPWSLLLVPGWRELAQLPLPEIVARQWATTMTILLDDLDALPAGKVLSVAYDDFLAAPQETMVTLCANLGIAWDRTLPGTLPLSPTIVSAPGWQKWRKNETMIERVWPIVALVDARARASLERHRR